MFAKQKTAFKLFFEKACWIFFCFIFKGTCENNWIGIRTTLSIIWIIFLSVKRSDSQWGSKAKTLSAEVTIFVLCSQLPLLLPQDAVNIFLLLYFYIIPYHILLIYDMIWYDYCWKSYIYLLLFLIKYSCSYFYL